MRIAINMGSGFVPGLNAVVKGAVLTAARLGWEVVGIRDGYDGIFFPERYPDGGVVALTPRSVESLNASAGSLVGVGARTDPFRVRTITPDHMVEEQDRSDDLLARLKKQQIDAVISVVGASPITGLHALTVALKLHRKGLRTICIPKSAENDVFKTSLAFGYNSVLNHTTEMLERIKAAAQDAGRIAVVEVLGQNAGWLALQSGMAVCADVILIPEIPGDIAQAAAALRKRHRGGHKSSLVVVAEGARPAIPKELATAAPAGEASGLRQSLTPNADPDLGSGSHVIARAGRIAEEIALKLQRLTDIDAFPLALGQLVRGGAASAVDLQLGVAYGAAAVNALKDGKDGMLLAFQLPDLAYVPLSEAVNKDRTVPADSLFVQTARSLGICLGDAHE